MIRRYIAMITLTLSFAVMLFAGIGLNEAMSAPTPGSESLYTNLATSTLDIEAVDENGTVVKNLFEEYRDETTLEIGKVYNETVCARNSLKTDGSNRADEFVRAIIRKYWTDQDGNKLSNITISNNGEEEIVEAINPDYIELLGMDDAWLLNPAESGRESSVYYLSHLLSSGEVSETLISGFRINKGVLDHYVEEKEITDNGSIVNVTYLYDDLRLNLEIEIQSVQANENAIRSVWGVDNIVIDGRNLRVSQ